jgi:hypothetical protein
LQIRIRDPVLFTRNAPDNGTDFAGYLANLKAEFRISGWIFNLTLKYLVKYEIIKYSRCIKGFLLPFLKLLKSSKR